MNRREFLECSAILISGVSASQMGWSLSPEQRQHLATAPAFIEQVPDYFTTAQRKSVAAMAETILPRTDTPGAIEAGVPRYIELMVQHWYNDDERDTWNSGLAKLMDDMQARHDRPFEQLTEAERVAALEELEAAASDSAWYSLTGALPGMEQPPMPFICQLKELTIWGFFTSEVGATQVLRYNPMPMKFDGAYPLDPDDSSWAGGML